MGRDIVKNLKFKKHAGKHFDPERFAQLLDESYRNTKLRKIDKCIYT